MELLPHARHFWVGNMMMGALTQTCGHKSSLSLSLSLSHTHTQSQWQLLTPGADTTPWRVWGLAETSLRKWVWSGGLKSKRGWLGRRQWGGGDGTVGENLREKDRYRHKSPMQGPGAMGWIPTSTWVLTMSIWVLWFYICINRSFLS